MRTVAILLLLAIGLIAGPVVQPAHAEPFTTGQSLDQVLVSQVTGAALAFMGPRTLDAIPVPQLSIWGLRGLTTLDPKFTPELTETTLTLLSNGTPILIGTPPGPTDSAGWGDATSRFTRAAWDASEAVRHAGTGGIIRTYFDELFNHFDPYSRYAPPDEAARDRLRRNGRIGIGITPALKLDVVIVQSVAPDSPAAKHGIRPGETLLSIDGQEVEGTDLSFVSTLLDGPEGSVASLILRGFDRRARTVQMTREAIVPKTVKASRFGDLLLLRVAGFARDTGERLGEGLAEGFAGGRKPRGIVIDLRGNRGGLLSQAVSAAQTLLDGGTIAATVGRDPEADHEFVSLGHDLGRGVPVVVIVDGRSASSAEILAAALADDGRAVIVGSSTLGKGVVQTVVTLPDGGDLYVTWSRVVAPFGWPIQGLGVLPQVCTSLGEARLKEQLDALDHGEQLLSRSLRRHRTARAPIPAAETLEIRNACPAAEGRDADMVAAKFLLSHQAAYDAALIHRP